MQPIKLSKETNEIQRLVALRSSRNKRFHYKEFIIEGRDALDQASHNGWKVKALYYNRDVKLSQWAKQHLASKNYDVAYALTQELMSAIADKADSAELIAVGEMRIHNFADYSPPASSVVVVLDTPKSAGNVGMIIRSAAAFGVDAVVISGHAADEYDPKSIRASVGTFFSTPIYRVEGITTFMQKMEQLKTLHNTQIIASGDRGSCDIDVIDCNAPLLFLVLGNETTGISVGHRQAADQFARIPLDGPFTSLNIGAAASILLYEIFRKRRLKLPPFQH